MEKRKTNRITKLDDDFNGVFFSRGKKFVLSGVLKNELVEYTEKGTSANTVLCNLERVIEKSELRVKPACPYAEKCGGCDLLHMSYDQQLKEKNALIRRKFSNKCEHIEEIVPSEQKIRNKIHIAFAVDGGKVILGFFDEKTHKVIDIKHCLLHGDFYDKLRSALLLWINNEHISLYNPKTKKGVLRFALARVLKDNIQLTLVVTQKDVLKYDTLYGFLTENFKTVSLYECKNDAITNQVMSDDISFKLGEERISATCAYMKYSVTPRAFLQTNSEIAEKVYLKAADIIDDIRIPPLVLDLFSGIGISSTIFAMSGYEVISAELVHESIEEGKRIAEENGVSSMIRFIEGDVNKLRISFDSYRTIAFVDPPRGGLKQFVDMLLYSPPKHILYLSCSLRTALADIEKLEEKFSLQMVVPFDMFPYTRHLEVLYLLSRKEEV